MNVLTFCLLMSTFIWSVTWQREILVLYLTVLGVYLALSLYFQRYSVMSFARKVQIAAYSETGDPSCYARIPIDLTAVDSFLEKYNGENPDLKLTYTHIALKAVGEAMSVKKKINGKLCFGNFVPLESVDVSVLVDVEGENLLNVLVSGANKHSLRELAQQIKGKIRKVKEKKDPELNHQMKMLSGLPTFLVELIFNATAFISYNLGLSIKALKVKPNSFGTAVVTNITGSGIYDVYAPHVNFCRSVVLAAVNDSRMLPVVTENGGIEPRKMLNFNITFDHRFADGSDAMHMLSKCKDVWLNPEKYL